MQLFGTSGATPVLGLPQLKQGDKLFVDGPLNYDGTANLKTYILRINWFAFFY